LVIPAVSAAVNARTPMSVSMSSEPEVIVVAPSSLIVVVATPIPLSVTVELMAIGVPTS